MYYRIILAIFLIAIISSSCNDEPQEQYNSNTDYNYFPLISGNYIDYEVTEIYIDKPSNIYDTLIYYMRKRIDIPFIESNGDTAYRIEIHKRSENQTYEVSDIWSAKLIENRAETIEENLRIVKVRFPLNLNKEWDGNLYNSEPPHSFTITGIHEPKTINNIQFDSVLTVIHDADSSIIHKKLSYEQYAYGIGLVYKEITDLNSQEPEPNVPVEERVTTGSVYIIKCLSYGVENEI
jgi:hypothetical protein